MIRERSISDVHLVNFKGFSRTTVPLRGLTLLSGLNGSGKSTILQALALVRQSELSSVHAPGELLLNGPLVELGTGRDVLFQNFDEQRIEIAISHHTMSGRTHQIWSALVNLDSDVLRPDALRDQSTTGFNLFDGGFQFLRADRITPTVAFPKSQDAIKTYGFLGARGEYTPHYLLEFGSEEVAHDVLKHPAAGAANSLLAQVNGWLQEFSPGVRVEPAAIPMTDFVRLEFTFKSESAGFGSPLRATNVGFGLTHSLPVVVACVGATSGTLITVENPEAQLHPQGQVAMGQLLARAAASGAQVVIESHSDHILNGIRLAVKQGVLNPDEVAFHYFKTNAGTGASYESPTIDSDGRLSSWPSGFFDEWERSLDQLLD